MLWILGSGRRTVAGMDIVLTERARLDGSLTAYVARPPQPRGGVLVVHELFGVTTHIREVCERLATLGYYALAPDLYHRSDPGAELAHDAEGRDRGFALLGELTRDGVLADLATAHAHLPGPKAIVGLSLGGHAAYLAATRLEFAAVVAAYPGWLTNTDIGLSRPEPTVTLTPSIRGRVLLLFGAADHAVPAADQRAVAAALAAAGAEHEVVTYPDTPHGFLCDRRDTYRREAAEDAWGRIGALL
jgi:carboxymethylenebutenolidase